MLRVLTVIGARPQFIKAAIVSRALHALQTVEEIIVHTGQHYDDNMSEVFFHELRMCRPDYNLSVGSGRHGEQTARMLAAIEQVLVERRPDVVLVYGDTNSTLAGALAAAKLNIPIAHVEAGLRSFNRVMPEEVNRVLTDHLARLLFAPTQTAVDNLDAEGIRGERVCIVGDVMYDIALLTAERASESNE
jgi:UDP-GlcNAc3NAcA epimerase